MLKSWFNKERLASAMSPILIILMSFLLVSLMMAFVGVNPVTAYVSLFSGAFGSLSGLLNTLTKAVPICLAAIGVAIASRAGIFNIGINGQIAVGAVGTVLVGVYLEGLPAIVHIPLALLAGMFFGVLYALLPAIAYIKKHINLLVIFLLTNTIANKFVTWIIYTKLKDPTLQSTATYKIQASAKLPNLIVSPAKLNIGVFIALFVVVIVYIYFYKTTSGFEMRTCGLNKTAANYAGINTNRYQFIALLAGGALAGLAGGIEVLGTYYRLYDGFSPAYGFDGIPIALLVNGNPVGIIVGSIVFGALRVGSTNMQIQTGVSSELVDVIQGTLITFIALEYIFHFISGKIVSGSFFRKARQKRSSSVRD